jgi:hypothetical protein
MANSPARSSTRLAPSPAWTVVTDAPLKGLVLAREAGSVFAWDEADQLYRIDSRGQFQSVARAPGKIQGAAVSDDGSLVALLGEGSRLWLLDGDFELTHERATVADPVAIAVDPHGRFAAVSSRLNLVQFYSQYGRLAGKFETRQPLSSMVFVPDRLFMVGTGAYGSISGIVLDIRANGSLDGGIAWNEPLMSGVGRLATTGDGQVILLACFTHGVQRYDIEGKSEGAYHLGGSAAQAVPDFAGRSIAVATMEGELALLSGGGHVRWRTTLNRPAIALENDALGRYVVYGQATGEIVRLDLQPTGRTAPAASTASRPSNGAARSRIGNASVRVPDWTAEVVQNEDQAEFAVLAVAESPTRIGVITHQNRLELFGPDGKRLGQAPEIDGVGRIVRTAPGWMAAATDRRIVLCDLKRNLAQRVDLSLAELTHLVILPDSYGLALVQERDRIGRATAAGRWIWKAELPSPVEEIVVESSGYTALTTEDGLLRVYDPAGAPAGEFRGPASDPALLVAAPAGSSVAWITLTRRAQVLRGHERSGRVAWETPIPWEAWQFLAVGTAMVVVAPDGRAMSFDASGHALAQGRADGVPDAFCLGPQGQPLRVARQGVHLICSDLGGGVAWRAVAEATIGPLAAGRDGLAVLIGKSLAWFQSARPS